MKFFLLLAVLAPAIAGAGVPIQNPMTAQLPRRMDLPDAEKTIKLALLELGWLIRKTEPGAISADIDVRGRHHVGIHIKYDQQNIVVTYTESENMDYEPCYSARKGNQAAMCIHENYHSWIGNTFIALPNALQKLELYGLIPTAVGVTPISPPSPPTDASPSVAPAPASGME